MFAGAALGVVAYAYEKWGRKSEPDRSPWLRVHAGAAQPSGASEAPVLWFALAALSSNRRSALLDEVEGAIASVEARHNPLLVDLVDDDVSAVFARHQRWFLPLCTAASALLAPRYTSPDGFGVEVLAAGVPPAGDDVRAWTVEAETPVARRARFLAWPASRSVLLRAESAGALERVRLSLGAACEDPTTALALVVDPGIAAGRSSDERLGRVLARLADEKAATAANGGPDLAPRVPVPGRILSPWIALRDGELLVVPKLGALSPRDRFDSELRRRIASIGSGVVRV